MFEIAQLILYFYIMDISKNRNKLYYIQCDALRNTYAKNW